MGAPVTAQVTIEAVAAHSARVGPITVVGDVPHSGKLVRLQVDFGDLRRPIFAGMKKERDDPREVEGRQALSVVNPAPRTIAGTVSGDALRHRLRGRHHAGPRRPREARPGRCVRRAELRSRKVPSGAPAIAHDQVDHAVEHVQQRPQVRRPTCGS